jgi:hypothetical protein
MSKENVKGKERVRCDVCKKLCGPGAEKSLWDAIEDKKLDVCCVACADRHWSKYQLGQPLARPYGNTGVTNT